MLGFEVEKYHTYVSKKIGTDRCAVDNYKEKILQQAGCVYLEDYIDDLVPKQQIKLVCNPRNSSLDFLDSVISVIGSVLSMEQAFYELMCEKRLMPIESSKSKGYISETLNVCYTCREETTSQSQSDAFDIPLLPFFHYIRVD